MMIREEMTVNGKSIQEYNARLLDYSVGGTERNFSISSVGSMLKLPTVHHTSFSPRQLSITLTFFPKAFGSESSRGSCIPERLSRSTDNITRFESEISDKVVEIGLPDGYIYRAYLQSCGTPSFDATGEQDVEYSFLAIRTKPSVKKTVTAGESIFCESNTATPFRLSMTIPSDVGSITVCGIIIRSLTAGTEIVIDSELGLVTANGANKFNETELIDFPYLTPGNNTVSCSLSGTEIIIVYTPIYA